MNTLIKFCGQYPQVTATRVYVKDTYNWEDYLDLFYNKLKKIKLYKIFKASKAIGNNKMISQTSKLDNA